MDANQMPHHVTIRDAIDEHDIEELHLECRFPDGRKGAMVQVSAEYPELAQVICAFLNSKVMVERVARRLDAGLPLHNIEERDV